MTACKRWLNQRTTNLHSDPRHKHNLQLHILKSAFNHPQNQDTNQENYCTQETQHIIVMFFFKVWLTYQKELFKSCVCSLDILQRWKAAWQVIHLQELIGRFANCLIDSKSNHQEIKAFCFTSQITHQLLSLKTKLTGMICQRAIIPEDRLSGKLMTSLHF